MNVDFSEDSRGGAKKYGFAGKRATCPPWTLRFLRVCVRSRTNSVNPGSAPASHGSPRGIGWARQSETCAIPQLNTMPASKRPRIGVRGEGGGGGEGGMRPPQHFVSRTSPCGNRSEGGGMRKLEENYSATSDSDLHHF